MSHHSHTKSGVVDQSVQTVFDNILKRIPELFLLTLSDKDGVALCTAAQPEKENDVAMVTAYAAASDQASKLGMGPNQSISAFYSDFIVISFNYFPLVITFVAAEHANVGLITSIVPKLKLSLEGVRAKIQ